MRIQEFNGHGHIPEVRRQFIEAGCVRCLLFGLAQSDPATPEGWQFDDRFRAAGVLRYTAPDGSIRVELSAEAPTSFTAAEWLDIYAGRYKKDHEIIKLSKAKQDANILAAVVRQSEPVQLTFVQFLSETPNLDEYLSVAERLAAESAMQPVSLDVAQAPGKLSEAFDLQALADAAMADVEAELKAEAEAERKSRSEATGNVSKRSVIDGFMPAGFKNMWFIYNSRAGTKWAVKTFDSGLLTTDVNSVLKNGIKKSRQRRPNRWAKYTVPKNSQIIAQFPNAKALRKYFKSDPSIRMSSDFKSTGCFTSQNASNMGLSGLAGSSASISFSTFCFNRNGRFSNDCSFAIGSTGGNGASLGTSAAGCSDDGTLLVENQLRSPNNDQGNVPASSFYGAPFIARMVGKRADQIVLGLNLGSGRYEAMPGNSDLIPFNALHSDASMVVCRDRSVPSVRLLTIVDCSEDLEDILCFVFVDSDGNGGFAFANNADYAGPGKASFDGTHVAVNLSDREGGLSAMSIYSRGGDLISRHFQSGYMRTSGPYDWLPDGRLAYAIVGNELPGDEQPTGIIITDPYSATPQRRIVLPDYYQSGTISTIESSPDGRQLLINIQPRVGPRRPMLLDTETPTVTQLVAREKNSVANVNNVSWGAAGRSVYGSVATFQLLSGDPLSGGDIAFIGSSDSLFAFEVNGTVHPVPESEADLSDSLRLIQTESLRNRGGRVGGGNYDSGQVWIP